MICMFSELLPIPIKEVKPHISPNKYLIAMTKQYATQRIYAVQRFMMFTAYL